MTSISHGSVATRLKHGGIVNDNFTAEFLSSHLKEVSKSDQSAFGKLIGNSRAEIFGLSVANNPFLMSSCFVGLTR